MRRCVFNSIDARFDPHLAQSDHLGALFLALQDEVFALRCLVLHRLGRLSDINPAGVQPRLRKVLMFVSQWWWWWWWVFMLRGCSDTGRAYFHQLCIAPRGRIVAFKIDVRIRLTSHLYRH